MTETLAEKTEVRICPKGHRIQWVPELAGRDFSGGDTDATDGRPMYKLGFYCLVCERVYGLSKLTDVSD